MKSVLNNIKAKHVGKKNTYIFMFAMLCIPILFFLVFNLGVKVNSVLLSLKQYDRGDYKFWGFGNFQQVFYDLSNNYEVKEATKNSIIFYGVNMLVILPLSVFTSYFVYKKIPGSEFFKIMCYLPQMVSAIVMTLMFKYLVDKLLPKVYIALGQQAPNVFVDGTKLGVMIAYNIWVGIGANIILSLGAMSRIPDQLIEVGELEGISLWKEFWMITFPLIFPTITVFIVTGVAGLFTNQAYVYNFYGDFAPEDIGTLGYFMFIKVIGKNSSPSSYPYASAFGVLFTLVAAPITLVVKYLLEKFGPEAEF